MGRLKSEFIDRIDDFAHRVVDVAESLERERKSRRIVDQLTGSGTSVGANISESDEALSRADFCKGLGTAIKELGETRFWLRFVSRRGWITTNRLAPLQTEAGELKLILGSLLSKSRKATAKAR
jgi:four helix bundle protein